MRPIDKGIAPHNYSNYSDARHDLANRIGYYCSYCEMKVYNSIEVEHVLPVNQQGNPIDWNNFLLSCKYCNTIKSDHNPNLSDYFWPDRDNTDLVFDYEENTSVQPKQNLNQLFTVKVKATINLMGLSRYPGGAAQPTEADTRWRSKKEVWDTAKFSLSNWTNAPIPELANSIALCALSSGHYSIWMKVFENEQLVLDEIDKKYSTKGLFKQFNPNGVRVIRPQGLI